MDDSALMNTGFHPDEREAIFDADILKGQVKYFRQLRQGNVRAFRAAFAPLKEAADDLNELTAEAP